MSRFLQAGGGAAGLRRRLLPTITTTTIITATTTRPALLTSPRSLAGLPAHVRHKTSFSWPEWMLLNPTTLEELKTVCDACLKSNIFSPTSHRPLTPFGPVPRPKRNVEDVRRAFRATPGLQPADWARRGLPNAHAVEIAAQLHRRKLFDDHPSGIGKRLAALADRWDRISAAARGDVQGNVVAAAAFAAARARIDGDHGDSVSSPVYPWLEMPATTTDATDGDGEIDDPLSVIEQTRRTNKELSRELRDAVRARSHLRRAPPPPDLAALARQARDAVRAFDADQQAARPRRYLVARRAYRALRALAGDDVDMAQPSAAVREWRRLEARGREIIIEKQVAKWVLAQGVTDAAAIAAKRAALVADDLTRNKFREPDGPDPAERGAAIETLFATREEFVAKLREARQVATDLRPIPDQNSKKIKKSKKRELARRKQEEARLAAEDRRNSKVRKVWA